MFSLASNKTLAPKVTKARYEIIAKIDTVAYFPKTRWSDWMIRSKMALFFKWNKIIFNDVLVFYSLYAVIISKNI